MNPFEMPPISSPRYEERNNHYDERNNYSNGKIQSNENIGLVEELLGFDEEFAMRVKKIWSDSALTKKTFQNDLNSLNSRWNFSLYLEGAGNSEDGLSGTLAKQILYGGGCIAFGSLLLSIADIGINHSRSIHHRGTGTATIAGIGSIIAGALIPVGIYYHRVKEAKEFNHNNIVEKNLWGRLSPLDCKRFSKALAWASEKGIQFDINNVNHLRGKINA